MWSFLAGDVKIETAANILRRKLRSEPASAEEQAVTPAKAARLSFARAADQAFDLPLRVNAIRQSRLDLADVVENLEESWAIYPLINDDGSVGIMCFDPTCVVAFMERQTMGSLNAVAREPRAITRTDKALAGAFLDVFFRLFDDALHGAPTSYWTRGYRAEDAVASKHLMVLLLDASEYRGFDMTCDLAGLEASVSMRLFLPIKQQNSAKAPQNKAKAKGGEAAQKPSEKTMRGAALAANVELDAIMCKLVLPLSELNDLKPGHVIPLPQNAASQAQLVDNAGHTSRAVNLGQLHGMRAVRLVFDDAEEGPETAAAIPPPSAQENPAPNPAAPQNTVEVQSETEQVPADPTNSGEIDELDALLAPSPS